MNGAWFHPPTAFFPAFLRTNRQIYDDGRATIFRRNPVSSSWKDGSFLGRKTGLPVSLQSPMLRALLSVHRGFLPFHHWSRYRVRKSSGEHERKQFLASVWQSGHCGVLRAISISAPDARRPLLATNLRSPSPFPRRPGQPSLGRRP
jgi:hypothetical protein